MINIVFEQICFDCNNGIMKAPYPVHTYDYTSDGKKIKSCTNCSICNDTKTVDSRLVVMPNSKHVESSILSRHKLKSVFWNLWSCSNDPKFDEDFRKHLFKKYGKYCRRGYTGSLYHFAGRISKDMCLEGIIICRNEVLDAIYTVLNT